MTVRIGLIGAGRVMDVHVDALVTMPGVEVVAVVDPRPEASEALARRLGAVSFTDHRDMLAAVRPTAVDIAIPHDLHFAVASDCFQAGAHVFMDKPMAITLEQGAALVAQAEDAGLTLMICHNLLFHPAVLVAKQMLDEGAIGRPTVAAAWSTGWLEMPEWDFRLSRERTGGGVWVDNGPHLLYVLEEMFGPVDELRMLPSVGLSRLGGEDACAGVARFLSGSTATLRISYSDRVVGHSEAWPAGWCLGYEFRGTEGLLALDVLPSTRLRHYDGGEAWQEIPVTGSFADGFAGALKEFVDSVRERRDALVSPSDAFHVLELVLGAYDQLVAER